jgi:hypothetical protein
MILAGSDVIILTKSVKFELRRPLQTCKRVKQAAVRMFGEMLLMLQCADEDAGSGTLFGLTRP